jgi:hypothetical protein
MAIDLHRFWNRSLPQTLMSALWLLYIRAFFDLVDLLGNDSHVGLTKFVKGDGVGALAWIVIIALAVAAGYFISQEKKIGYYLGVAASLAPFVINIWVTLDNKFKVFYGSPTISERLFLGSLSDFGTLLWLMFTVALVILLLHPMSRDYVRVWFK